MRTGCNLIKRNRKQARLGKGWVDRDPPVVKLKVMSTRRKQELLRILRNSRSSGANPLPSSQSAHRLL